jgi:hypothetical protein
MCEYGTLKPVEVISWRGVEEERRIMEGMNQTGVQYMCIWKCHNRTPPI